MQQRNRERQRVGKRRANHSWKMCKKCRRLTGMFAKHMCQVSWGRETEQTEGRAGAETLPHYAASWLQLCRPQPLDADKPIEKSVEIMQIDFSNHLTRCWQETSASRGSQWCGKKLMDRQDEREGRSERGRRAGMRNGKSKDGGTFCLNCRRSSYSLSLAGSKQESFSYG